MPRAADTRASEVVSGMARCLRGPRLGARASLSSLAAAAVVLRTKFRGEERRRAAAAAASQSGVAGDDVCALRAKEPKSRGALKPALLVAAPVSAFVFLFARREKAELNCSFSSSTSTNPKIQTGANAPLPSRLGGFLGTATASSQRAPCLLREKPPTEDALAKREPAESVFDFCKNLEPPPPSLALCRERVSSARRESLGVGLGVARLAANPSIEDRAVCAVLTGDSSSASEAEAVAFSAKNGELQTRAARVFAAEADRRDGHPRGGEGKTQTSLGLGQALLFASVIDGHGGAEVSEFVSRHIPTFVDAELSAASSSNGQELTKSLSRAFQKLDSVIADSVDAAYSLGQSRSVRVVCKRRWEQPRTPRGLVDEFLDSFGLLGSQVLYGACYVKGRLQPTRAFGDFYLKSPKYASEIRRRRRSPSPLNSATPAAAGEAKSPASGEEEAFSFPYVSVTPETKVVQRSAQDAFVILASDGVWDWLEPQEAVRVAADALIERHNAGLSAKSDEAAQQAAQA